MSKLLKVFCVFTAVLSGFSQAAKHWDVHTPISGGSISSPVKDGVYLCGASVDFSCSRGSDTDHWCDTQAGTEDWPSDAMNSNYPQWTATKGSWKDGDSVGTSVEWIAPNSTTNWIDVHLYENDLTSSIPSGDSGTRNDPRELQDTVTRIRAVIPVLNTVEYGAASGAKYAIHNVVTPEYVRGIRNDSACWGLEARGSATATFHHTTLSQAEGGVIVRADTTGDMFNWDNSSMETWGASSPTPSQTCNAEMLMDDAVMRRDYSAQWKYRCTEGSNRLIYTTIQPRCRLYVVLDQPKSPESEPNEIVLAYATKWADGCSTKESACNDIVAAFADHYNWDYNCNRLASDFVRLVASLGVSASENRWAARDTYFYLGEDIFVGDMVFQRIKTIDPVVGKHGSKIYELGFHEWAQAENNQYDPTTADHLDDSSWGDYEDELFTHYRVCISVDPYSFSWVAAQAGQSIGCEEEIHRHYTSDPTEVLEPWLGPS